MIKFKAVKRRTDIELGTPPVLTPPVKTKTANKNEDGTLPIDKYFSELNNKYIIPLNIESETSEYELHIDVTRDGEFGLPHLSLRQKISSPKFTGFSRKGFAVPIEHITELINCLTLIEHEIREKDLL